MKITATYTIIIWVLLGFLCPKISLSQNDTLTNETERNYFIAIPILFYGEETSWGFGATTGYYFTKEGLNKASNIQGTAVYTLKNQASISLYPKIYTSNRDFFYSGHINANYYPDKFFGIGRNTPGSNEESYTSKELSALIQRQRVLFGTLMAGVQINLGYNCVQDLENGGVLILGNITGTKPYFSSGIGVVMTWDTRNNNFYPTEGSFYKVGLLVNNKIFGSKVNYSQISIDLREFYPINKKHLVALQIFSEITWGDTPFQQMPTLGGSDILRGYYKGRYRDMMMFSAQAEYRFPIYKWLKGSAFCAAGDVFNQVDNISFKEFKLSGGLGLRTRVNPANVHLRFDVGFTQERKPAYYLTASEAF